MNGKICAFSLVELMVTLAIITVIAVVGIPAYKDYMIKVKVSKAYNATLVYADLIRDYYELKLDEIDSPYVPAIAGPLGISYDNFNWIFEPPYVNTGDTSEKLNIYYMYYEGHPADNPPNFRLYISPATGDSSIDGLQGFAYACKINNSIWECACAQKLNTNNNGVDLKYLPQKCTEYGSTALSVSGFFDP